MDTQQNIAMSQALATINPQQQISAFNMLDAGSFDHAIKVASFLAKSSLVPVAFQKNPENCMIVMELAHRMGMGAFSVMQNIDIIHGKPSWRSQFIIGMINASKRFSPLRFKQENVGQIDPAKGPTWSCYAYAKSTEDGEEVKGVTIDIAMAKKEGWWGKANSKWPSMTELMLIYRAATLFGRMYAPEMLNGIQSSEEVFDINDRALPVVDESGNPVDAPIEQSNQEPVRRTRKGANAAKDNEPKNITPVTQPTPPLGANPPEDKPATPHQETKKDEVPAPTPEPPPEQTPATPPGDQNPQPTSDDSAPLDIEIIADAAPKPLRCEVVKAALKKANDGSPLAVFELKNEYVGVAYMLLKADQAIPASPGNIIDVVLKDKLVESTGRTLKMIEKIDILG